MFVFPRTRSTFSTASPTPFSSRFSLRVSAVLFPCTSGGSRSGRIGKFHSSTKQLGDGEVSPSERITGPLEGIKVLDLSRVLAAPFATMILGDLGAEVIKVEAPDKGDDTRGWGPPFTSNGEMSAYFAAINRNKKSITVDFKTPQGQSIIHQLARQSDILVENYIPGKLQQFNLSYADLAALNPRLIYCSLTGFGPDGPYKDRPGVDVMVEALGGLMDITGHPDGQPAKVGVAITDICTGLFAHGAILAALHHRHRTGRGQHIHCSLLETQLACLVNIASNYLIDGTIPTRMGTAHPSIVPYQTFPTKDGYIMIGATNDGQWRKLCECLGRPDWGQDARFALNKDRVKHRATLQEMLEGVFRGQTTEAWLGVLQTSGISYAPINNVQKALEDPQVIHRGLVKETEHKSYGKIKMVGPPVQYSDSPPQIRHPPPLLGENTDSVLASLGYKDDDIKELRRRGII